MKLVTRCQSCHQDFNTRLFATDRVQLENERGSSIRLTCNHCSSTRYYHVNQIKASQSNLSLVTGLLIIVVTIATILAVNYLLINLSGVYILGSIFVLPAVVILAYRNMQENNIRAFNSYRVHESKKKIT
ncbi:MAG: hypothetical protein AAF598_13690 [Bacteroidota bacterium]